MTLRVVNIRTCNPPWGQDGDMKIDRTTIFGNPYPLYWESERDRVIKEYEVYLLKSPTLLRNLQILAKAERLGCWCKPKPCHGDVIIKIMKERGLI